MSFFNFYPEVNQESVPKTTVINFSIGLSGVDINTLNVGVSGVLAIEDGVFVNDYMGSIFTGVDKYVVSIYPKPPYFSSGQVVVVSLSITGLDSLEYSFTVKGVVSSEVELGDDSIIPCSVSGPSFPNERHGLKVTLDKGTGTEVGLEWLDAIQDNQNNIILYNVYYDTNQGGVFDAPDFISDFNSIVIGGLAPGDVHYFGVRAAEVDPDLVDLESFEQAGENLYFYPVSSLNLDLSIDGYEIIANVDGFPSSGVVKIGGELISYTGFRVGLDGFVVGSRGYGGLVSAHSAGDSIVYYNGIEDGNSIVVWDSPTFQKPNYALTYNLSDGYGADGYRDGYDGYAYSDGYLRFQVEPFDNITTNGDDNDASGEFPRFDFCGTWRAESPASFMQGQCKPSYFGGARVAVDSNGNRVLVKNSNIRDQMLQREEILLESTGEPVVLLRRQWTGTRCPCFMSRREHPDARCPICYGVGFVSGYGQVFNPRRPDSRILVRLDPSVDDVSIVDRGGLEPNYEPSGWTMAYPMIRDRDILVRFNPDGTEAWRFEILNVTRVRAFFAQSGAQKFAIKRMPKTDIIYQYPVLRETNPRPANLETGISSSSGVVAHSHGVVIEHGMDLKKLKVSTLVSEHHNHIILNGVVQPALGHTHTLG